MSASIQLIYFPNPEMIDPIRPRSSYRNQGAGFHLCPGIDFAEDTFTGIIKYLSSSPGSGERRAPRACSLGSMPTNSRQTGAYTSLRRGNGARGLGTCSSM